MENRKFIKLAFVGLVLFSTFPVFAYDAETAHPALTQESIKFFEYGSSDDKFSAEEKEKILAGSRLEDSPEKRCLNHFFDPVYNRGLFLSPTSKRWAVEEDLQGKGRTKSGYYTAPADYSWERAIYDYVYGDKDRGLEALGHILHLVQDASVPDHTRNDSHLPYLDFLFEQSSPYEKDTKQYTTENFDVFNNLIILDKKPKYFSSLGDYFSSMAKFSNNNFFSKDTIEAKEYRSPLVAKIDSEIIKNKKYNFGYSSSGNKLVFVKNTFDKDSGELIKQYSLNDENNLVLSDYWRLLSEQAVLHSAGVIDLFFKEVEKEKQTKELFAKNEAYLKKQNESLAQKVTGLLASVKNAFGFGEEIPPAEDDTKEIASDETGEPEIKEPIDDNVLRETELVRQQIQELYNQLIRLQTIIAGMSSSQIAGVADSFSQVEEGRQASLSVARSIISSGGDHSSGDNETETSTSTEIAKKTETEIGDEEPDIILPPVIIEPTSESGPFLTRNINFSGTASSSQIVFTDFNGASTTADTDGNWQIELVDLPEGTSTIKFYAMLDEANISDPAEIDIVVATPKIFGFKGVTCITPWSDIWPDKCIGYDDITLSWEVESGDLVDHYEATYFYSSPKDGDEPKKVLTIPSEETSVALPDGFDGYWVIVAYLKDETIIKSAAIQVDQIYESAPVVINEIAWKGTKASSKDEWVEIYNPYYRPLPLDNLVLIADGLEGIHLSGSISSEGYYLIEIGDENVTDQAQKLVFPSSVETGILSDDYPELRLEFVGNGHEDDPLILDTVESGEPICAKGDSCVPGDSYYIPIPEWVSAERCFASNGHVWQWKLQWKNGFGRDREGNLIEGTPNKNNSCNYIVLN